MKKIYIAGGDNCCCAICGGLCDRFVVAVDTTKKTLSLACEHEFCLGGTCWMDRSMCGEYEGWTLKRESNFGKAGWWYKYYAENEETGEKIPVTVKDKKWGKDGEYGSFGFSYGGKDGALMRWKSKEAHDQYYETLGVGVKLEECLEPTGYVVIMTTKGDK